jgi:arylsulfatase A-like enzyme
VSRSELALPRVLRDNGYATLAAGKWHLSTFAIGVPDAYEWPRQFGFQHFLAGRIGNLGQTVTYTNWPRIDDGVRTDTTEYNTTAVRRAASQWWEQTTGPKFAYVAFHAPHAPFHVPPSTLLPPGQAVGSDDRSKYEAMVMALDAEVGKLLAKVDLENTLVIFVSDNGTPTNACARGQDTGKAKGSVFEGGIHVPLIVAGWGAARGRTTEALVSVTDLFATILELTQIPRPVGHAIDSVSFARQLYVPELRGRDWVYSQTFAPNGFGPKDHNARAVVTKRYKLMADERGERLFDLEHDPDETHPLPLRGGNAWIRDRLRGFMSSMASQGAP